MDSEDLAWLRAGEGQRHFHAPGPWPFGIHGYAGCEDNDLVLWLPSINAIVTLLNLLIELVLPAHGAPTDLAAFKRALT